VGLTYAVEVIDMVACGCLLITVTVRVTVSWGKVRVSTSLSVSCCVITAVIVRKMLTEIVLSSVKVLVKAGSIAVEVMT
jgi:hypothetical protein